MLRIGHLYVVENLHKYLYVEWYEMFVSIDIPIPRSVSIRLGELFLCVTPAWFGERFSHGSYGVCWSTMASGYNTSKALCWESDICMWRIYINIYNMWSDTKCLSISIFPYLEVWAYGSGKLFPCVTPAWFGERFSDGSYGVRCSTMASGYNTSEACDWPIQSHAESQCLGKDWTAGSSLTCVE